MNSAMALVAMAALALASRAESAGEKPEAPEKNMKLDKAKFGIAVHGGAGTIDRTKMTPEREREYRAGLERALTAGYEILKRGGSSLDATEAAVRVLEDDPHFNARAARCLRMRGRMKWTRQSWTEEIKSRRGSELRHIRNPISLARMLMDKAKHASKSPHVGPVMMAADGAEAFAKKNGTSWPTRNISTLKNAGTHCRK